MACSLYSPDISQKCQQMDGLMVLQTALGPSREKTGGSERVIKKVVMSLKTDCKQKMDGVSACLQRFF